MHSRISFNEELWWQTLPEKCLYLAFVFKDISTGHKISVTVTFFSALNTSEILLHYLLASIATVDKSSVILIVLQEANLSFSRTASNVVLFI